MLENKTHTKHKTSLGLRTIDIVAAYTLLRIVVGINYFNHGATRIFNIPGFMDAMVNTMQDSWIPELLVRINAALYQFAFKSVILVRYLTGKSDVRVFFPHVKM